MRWLPSPTGPERSEKRLSGASLSDAAALKEASWAWVYDTQPLPGNAWKVEATCGLLHRALNRLARTTTTE